MNYYLCSKCYGIVQRESDKDKINSYCDETTSDCVLQKINSADELAVKLRKRYLRNNIDLSTFSKKEIMFLTSAFEQGATVVFNRLKLK